MFYHITLSRTGHSPNHKLVLSIRLDPQQPIPEQVWAGVSLALKHISLKKSVEAEWNLSLPGKGKGQSELSITSTAVS